MAFILILRWNWTPTFIDIYYHLLAAINFKKAGGVLAVSLWEHAPCGRPHLYPPLLHILMLSALKLNISILTVARFFELISFPVVLVTLFITIKRFFSPRMAFWSVLISSSMYSFYLSCVDFLAASLAFSLGLLAFYSLEKKKIIAAIIFMSLCFYSHTSISLFFLLALIIYSLFKKEQFKNALAVIIFSTVIYLPWLIHQLRFLGFVDISRVQENFPFELNILGFMLAVFGLGLAIKNKHKYNLALIFMVAVLPFLPLRYRFISGQGILGVILLAAIALDYFYNKIWLVAFKLKRAWPVLIYILAVLLGLFLVSPTVTIKNSQAQFNLFGSTYANIFPGLETKGRDNEISIYLPKAFKPVFDVVLENTLPGDLITSNFEYLAGFISVFTDRKTTSAMLSEIKPFKELNPFRYAKLIIWLKDPQMLTWQPEALIKALDLTKIAETEVFYIYENPNANIILAKDICAGGKLQLGSKPIVPLGVCLGILIGFSLIAGFDLSRKV
jgi:hypothetical protein